MNFAWNQQDIDSLEEERQAKIEHEKEDAELMDRMRTATTAARTRRAQ